MYSKLNSLKDVLVKLSKIRWVAIKESKGGKDTLVSAKGRWELGYRINEMSSLPFEVDLPLQVQLILWYEGKVILTWGMESNKENADFLRYFKGEHSRVREEEFQAERLTEKVGKEMFNNL